MSPLLLVVVCTAAPLSNEQRRQAEEEGLTPPPECLDALEAADIDDDGRVDGSEYHLFLSSYRPDVVPAGESFFDLDLTLQSTFYSLACLCSEYGDDDCCLEDNAHLPASPDAPTMQLMQLCTVTWSTLDSLPTLPPVPTTTPTRADDEDNDAPTEAPALVTFSTARVVYTILVADGKVNQTDYKDNLVQSMNRLGMDLQQQESRGLRLLVQSPPHKAVIPIDAATSIILAVNDTKEFSETPILTSRGVYFGEGPCPADFGNPSVDLCAEITHQVPIIEGQEEEEERQRFEDELQTAILGGELQTWLDQVAPNTIVTVLSGLSSRLVEQDSEVITPSQPGAVTREESSDDSLASGTIFGIVAGAMGLVGLVSIFVVKRGGRQSSSVPRTLVNDGDNYHAVESVGSDELEAGLSPQSPERPKNLQQEPTSSPDASAPESDSGWSSSQGQSSRDNDEELSSTMGVPDINDRWGRVEDQAASALQFDVNNTTHMMDLQELYSRNIQEDEEESQTDNHELNVPLTTLEQAILVGDWSAVGASASILASTYRGEFDQSIAASTDTSVTSMQVDSEEVEGLDKLIEAGNWEAVMAAAAKFQDPIFGSDLEGSSEGTQSSFEDQDLYIDPEVTSISNSIKSYSTSTTAMKMENTNMAQIVALLEKIAIDDLGNANDLLEQFQGREDDLIDMLKAMEQQQHSPSSVTKF